MRWVSTACRETGKAWDSVGQCEVEMAKGTGKAERPSRMESLISLSMAVVSAICEETHCPHDTGASLPPCKPWRCQEVLYHCPSLDIAHPTSHHPRKSPEPHVRDRISLPRGWGSGLGVWLDETHQGFSQHQNHLHFSFACLSSLPPIFCSNESMGRLCR